MGFRKVLIANRGEIAIRIQRTLQSMGIPSVAVHSDVDATAPHVVVADEAWSLGEVTAYLDIDKLVDIAKRSDCDAVHPGYGFLSENATFARRCGEAGLVFIGPPADAIEIMGSKLRAREVMQKAGVPVVPGSEASDNGLAGLAQAARQMKYPVLIKASAGGGGKGMRIVEEPEKFLQAAEAAKGEAQKAFGDGTLYLEKYLRRPRHIEVQVFADAHGNVVHLFERECSIQRRHQKIIEEAPSLAVDASLRRKIGETAVAAAKAVDYRGAGTVEFLMDENGDYYFLEMNTRLQVEHPVTEEITGLDLVRLQVEVAMGDELAEAARNPGLRGHAIECRVYAEDPGAAFLPGAGRIERLRLPHGPGIRVDAALQEGMDVSIHYDPMLAKVITFGSDRKAALGRMRQALGAFVILGIPTNLEFLQDVLAHKAFTTGDLSTHFIDDHLPQWKPAAQSIPPRVLAATFLAQAAQHKDSTTPGIPSPWQSLEDWVLGGGNPS